MALSIKNQRPADLNPFYSLPINGTYDPTEAIRTTLIEPIFEPLNPSIPVSLIDGQNRDIDADELLSGVVAALGDVIDPAMNKDLKSLLRQSTINYDATTPLLFNESFAIQTGTKLKLPAPTASCLYTAQSDVIPAAKKMLTGASTDGDELFVSLAYAYHPETLGFYFNTSADFDACKAWIATQAAALSNVLPGDTNNTLAQFGQLTLKDLTESLIIRAHDADQNQDYSFARVIVDLLMAYTQQVPPSQYGVMPFVLSELYSPQSLIFVNVEAHARATPGKVASEWKLINGSIASPVKVVSNKAISKLTALSRASTKAQKAASAVSNKTAMAGRTAKITFRKQRPSKATPLRDILRVLKSMGQVNRSQNVFRTTKSTFVKANRRDPDDYNKQGTITSVKYMPDLHIYIDTSGSISEKHYQSTVIMLIHLAKKMNVNLYFSSFSHVLSQETLLITKDKSIAQIWKEFRKIPKVTGGTDFQQIWTYINQKKERQRRLSLVITDFEWMPRNQREEHPRNLYYAPISEANWSTLTHWAKNYVDSMQHIEPNIGQRIIGMIG